MTMPTKRAASRVYRVPGSAPRPQQRSPRSLRSHAMTPVDEETLGGLIRANRLQHGWTQEYLADMVGVRQAQISAYEVGKVQMPDKHVLGRLDDVFGFERGTLLGMSGWKGAKSIVESGPKAGAIVIEDPSPEVEHLIDIVANLEPETVQRIIESATVEFRTEMADASTDNEAQAPDHLTIIK